MHSYLMLSFFLSLSHSFSSLFNKRSIYIIHSIPFIMKFSLSALIVAMSATVAASEESTTEAVPCIGNISSLSIGDTCTGTWSDLRDILRPTQKSVGFAWVFRQQQLKMKTKEQAQQSLNKKLIPVSLGPDGTAYILDAHHSLSALDLSGFKSTVIALTVSCDSLINVPASQQLNELASRKFAYLYGRVPGCPNTLPTAIPTASIPTNIAFRKSAVTMEDGT